MESSNEARTTVNSNPGSGASTSRRGVLRVGLAVIGAGVSAGVCANALAQTKIAKAMVQYQDQPKGDLECDHCLHFQAPEGCAIVDGKINPKGWCAVFAAKPK